MQTADATPTVNAAELEERVKRMYRDVAENPQGEFHFEMGRALAERLGYSAEQLDNIPPESIDSFAGVGYHFHLARIEPGERVLDLGCGSGMDTFIASRAAGSAGEVVGVDMTQAQLKKSARLRDAAGVTNVRLIESHIESIPVPDGSFDVVISNGVINLSAEKQRVFSEAARALKVGGRLAIADIVTEMQLPQNVTCDATLWAACIGGAAQQDSYREMIEEAGLKVVTVQNNPEYRFLSKSAKGATEKWGVKSVSILAVKER